MAPGPRTIREGLSKDTVLCVSLAARPSNRGTRFHNYLYDALGLDYVYKAFAPGDIAAAVAGIRGLAIRGAGVSMPFKEAVLGLVDEVSESARVITSANTIVNDTTIHGGHLTAHNTDYLAVAALVGAPTGDGAATPVVAGSGGMAKAVVAALRDQGWPAGVVASRNETTGVRLADAYGWTPAVTDATGVVEGAFDVGDGPLLLVNATPLGMDGGDPDEAATIPFSARLLGRASTVVDVVAMPAQTPLLQVARTHGARVVDGAQISTVQALEQFVLYTGVRPPQDLVEEAAAFAAAA